MHRSSTISSFLMLVVLLAVVCTNMVTPAGALSSNPASASPAQNPWYSYCNYYGWHSPYCYYYPSYYPYYYSSYYPYYYPSYYYSTPTPKVDTPKSFELKVATNPTGVSSVTGGGSYSQGTIASFSITSVVVPAGPNQRYVFSYWSGDFSGSAPSGSVTMMSAKTITANYYLENYLRAVVEPLGVASAVGQGWYQSDEEATVGPVPQSVSGGEGTRYLFQHWTIDGFPASGNPVVVGMNTPHTIVAHYRTQYLLKVSSEYGIVEGGGWYDAGSQAPISVTTQIDVDYGVKRVFDRWTGDIESGSSMTTVVMDSPHTAWALWRTDSSLLYTTFAFGLAGTIVLVMGLVAVLILRTPQAKPVPQYPPKPIPAVKEPPSKTKQVPTRKKVKPQPKPVPEDTE